MFKDPVAFKKLPARRLNRNADEDGGLCARMAKGWCNAQAIRGTSNLPRGMCVNTPPSEEGGERPTQNRARTGDCGPEMELFSSPPSARGESAAQKQVEGNGSLQHTTMLGKRTLQHTAMGAERSHQHATKQGQKRHGTTMCGGGRQHKTKRRNWGDLQRRNNREKGKASATKAGLQRIP